MKWCFWPWPRHQLFILCRRHIVAAFCHDAVYSVLLKFRSFALQLQFFGGTSTTTPVQCFTSQVYFASCEFGPTHFRCIESFYNMVGRSLHRFLETQYAVASPLFVYIYHVYVLRQMCSSKVDRKDLTQPVRCSTWLRVVSSTIGSKISIYTPRKPRRLPIYPVRQISHANQITNIRRLRLTGGILVFL